MKLKYKICVLGACFFIHSINAQNLVPNPGFEEFSYCPKEINYDSKELIPKFWFSPTRGTSDYFNSCSKFNVSVPVNLMGSTFAAQGHAYVGLIVLEKPDFFNFDRKKPVNYREYISCKLHSPLQKDSLYCIKFKFAIADFSTYAINGLGFALSEKLTFKITENQLLIPYIEQAEIELDTLEQSVWYIVDRQYKALGGEQYLTIGNFCLDNGTEYVKLDYSHVPLHRLQRVLEDGFAYYYIDDVSVCRLNTIDVENQISDFVKHIP